MATKAVKEQLEELVPKTLDDIIRRHKDQACLHISTPEDLKALVGKRLPGERAVPVSRWNFVTCELNIGSTSRRDVILTGHNEQLHCFMNSSPVQIFDGARSLVTRTGSPYYLCGPQGTDEDIDLLHLCIQLRKSPLAEYFGIPPFFY